MAGAIDYGRLVAPREHLGLLIEPDGGQIRRWLRGNDPPHIHRVELLGRPVGDLRTSLCERLGLRPPVAVTGHQAEFYHAGVFAKAIAASVLVQERGDAVFLTVDSDLLKAGHLVVPAVNPHGLRRIAIPFTEAGLDLPVENQPASSREHWLDVFARAAATLGDYRETLFPAFTDAFLKSGRAIELATAIPWGRAAVEQALGLRGCVHLLVSQLSETPEFRIFAGHLALNAAGFAGAYNRAREEFRRRFRVRHPGRPVPSLQTAGDRTELPLWIYSGDGRRRRLFVRQVGDFLELLADTELAGRIDRTALSRDGLTEISWSGGPQRIRPRALALSCFARLLIGDVFIHGIGGAQYDAMTDVFAREFFGSDLPPIACVTATMHLPLPRTGATKDALRDAQRGSRDVRHNPQRYLKDIPANLLAERESLIARSAELRATGADRDVRREVFNQLRRVKEDMLKVDPWRVAGLDDRVEGLSRELERDSAALDREYFFAFQRGDAMRQLAGAVQARLNG